MKASKKHTANQGEDLRPVPDGELAGLRARLAQKQEYIAILELELFNTRADLNDFTEIYNRHIAPLQRRANKLRKVLFKTLEAKRGSSNENPDDYPDMMGANGFANNGNGAKAEDSNKDGNNTNPRSKNKKQAPEKRDPELEEKIRALFRGLAKRFHPDLTNDPEEKKWREKIMTRVNQAYTARDLETLLELANQPDINGKSSNETHSEEILRLKTEIRRLEQVSIELETILKQIDISPVMQLRLEVTMVRRDGRDLIEDMVGDLKLQILDLEEHLFALGVEIDKVPA